MYSNRAYSLRSALFKAFPFIERIYAFNRTFRNRWVAAVAKTVPAGSRVLDVGAGSCPYRDLFAHCDYVTHDFVQLTPEQLAGRSGYGQIDLVSTVESIPAESASFDVILCTEVIEHVPAPIEAVKEFARLAKPGGLLIVSAPMRSGLHQTPYHFYGGYTPFWYEKFLTEFGFKDIDITPVGGLFMAFAEESQRVVLYLLFPHGSSRHVGPPTNVLARVLGLFCLPLFGLLVPPLCYAMEKIYLVDGYRLGNCVTATRSN